MTDETAETAGEGTFSGKNYDDSDSLRNYYHQLSRSEPLTAEEELSLWKEMESRDKGIRTDLYSLGFVLSEHVKLFRDCPPENLSDFFSSSRDGRENTSNALPLVLGPWIDSIEQLYTQMGTAFHEGKTARLEKLRMEAADLLMRHPVSTDKLYEWFDVAKVFLNHPDAAGEESRKTIEEKMFCSLPDFQNRMIALEQAFAGLETTRKRILTANLRLVVSLVRPYRRPGVQTSDLIQEGNLGLIKALERFDYKLGHKFSTYATWWIKQFISRAIASQTRIIRLPAHMLATISRINRAEREFVQKNGRDPSPEELALILEMPRERVNAIRKMAAQAISLQAPVREEADSPTLEQILCSDDDDADNPIRDSALRMLQERLKSALERLPEREQQILTMRFGLSGREPMTLGALSKLFGLTRERIRQIEMRAIRKLKNPKYSLYFQDYFH